MSLVLRQLRSVLLVLAVGVGLFAGEGTGTGLSARYYANETLSGSPAVSRIDAQVNFAWSGGAPASALPVDSFSARWDGEVEARFTQNLTFIARTDDGVRLWIDNQLVIDAWYLRGAADSSYTFAAEAGRKYRVRMEYYEHFGSAVAQLLWQSTSIPRAAIPSAYLYPTPAIELPSGSGTGLLARYYANETLSGIPVHVRTDARVDFGWGGGSPDGSVPVESFSARWDGEIEARVSEPLTLIARTDDGVRVWLNGQVVIDSWILRSAADSTYTFTAEAGRKYRIRMEYYEHTGAAVARLWWQSANEPKGPIPTSQLYPTDPSDPPNGTGTGLLASYFANETLSGTPVLNRTEARVDHAWGSGSPGTGVPVDVFSARWLGEIEPRTSEPLTLIARTDDGVRLWIDGQLVIDQWILRGAADSTYTFSAEAGRKYRIQLEYFEHLGSAVAKLWWQSASEPRAPIPTSQLYPTPPPFPPAGTGTGLTGTYFANETLTGEPALTRLDPRVDFSWGSGSPGSPLPVDVFSVRWQGEIEPRVSEPLTLIARTDDGVRVWIDDVQVINAWILRGAADSTHTFTAQAGHKYRIRMEYFEHLGSAVAKLWWQSANEPKGPIPTSQLYPITSTPTTPSIAFANAGTTVGETVGSSTVTVNLSQPAAIAVTVAIQSTGSGATAPATITIPAGDTTASVPVTISDDPRFGPDRQATLSLVSPVGADLGPITSHVLTIQNTDPAPTIAFTALTSFNLEQSGTASVPVRLSAVSAQTTTVTVSLSGSASPGIDYQAPSATLQIPADTFEGTIFIPLFADSVPEQDETIILTLSAPVGATLGSPSVHTITLSDGNQSPVIANGPTPAVNPVTGTAVSLSFSATDDGGADNLTFTWSTVGTVPAPVSFAPATGSVGTSSTTTATFTAPGTYPIQIQVRDAYEVTAIAQAIITVQSTPALITVVPAMATIALNGTQAFTAAGTNQFGTALPQPLSVTWSVSGGGTIAANGVFTSGTTAGGPFTVLASLPTAQGNASITVIDQAPILTQGPTATVDASATGLILSAVAADDGGEAALTYQWSVEGTAPGTVQFAANGSNAAKSTTATLSAVGTYVLRLTATDAANQAVSATTSITVAQRLTTLAIAPDTVSLTTGAEFDVTLTSRDQFGALMTGIPSPMWSIIGGGTITPTVTGAHLVAGSEVGGPFTLTAVSGAIQATAAVTIVPTTGQAQTITFAPLPAKTYGDAAFTLTASATSGLLVSFSSSDTSVATVSGTTVTIVGAGTTNITAAQDGNATWEPAAPVVQPLAVAKAPQIITFAALTARTIGDAPFALTATASSGLPVSYTSSHPDVATVTGDQVTIVAAGTTTITAIQTGGANHLPAESVPQVLTVSKAPQTITFAALSAKTYGDAPFPVTATASSGLPVELASSDTAVATILDGTVTIHAAGTTIITATQPGDATWDAAASVPQTLTVNKAAQTITFAALSSRNLGDLPFTITATASSGLPVTFTSSVPSVATVSGDMVTIVAAGTTAITAEQAGNGNYLAAASVAQPLMIAAPAKQTQTITFAPLPAKTYGDAPFALTATASSSLPVSYTSSDPAIASITGATVTILKGGTVTITAAQAGDAQWDPAVSVPQELTINKAAQTITFAALSMKSVGEQVALSASTTSGLSVTYANSNAAVATISSSGSTLYLIGVGTTLVTASQAGDDRYLPAQAVIREQVVEPAKQEQYISFYLNPYNLKAGDPPYELSAYAYIYVTVYVDDAYNSYSYQIEEQINLPITFTSSDPTIASISGNMLTPHTMGIVTITASQPGDSTYRAAQPVSQQIRIKSKGTTPQTITFPAFPPVMYGQDVFLPLTATASSGLPVTYINNSPWAMTIEGNSLRILNAGYVSLRAIQLGDDQYQEANDVTQYFQIAQAPQAITFPTLPNKPANAQPFPLTATSSAGLVVSYVSSDPTVASVSGNIVTVLKSGTTTITARQFGNGNYLAATPVAQTLTVERLEQTIDFTTVPALTLGSAPVTLQATTDSGLPITITSSDPSVAVVRGTTLYLIRAGSAVLTAAQAGDDIHAPAQATQSITIQAPTAPEPGTPVDWQADLAIDLDFSPSQTGSDPEVLEDVKYHYSKDDTIQVFIAGRSASGAYIDRIVVTLGDQQDEITGPSGMAEFPGLAEGEHDLSVHISAHHGEDAGSKSFERFGQADEPNRMSVDRTKPVLTLLLPKRFWLDAGDREPGVSEFPLVRNDPPRFWVNKEVESWNKSLRTKYSRETFGQTDLGNGVIAAVADVTGVDKRIAAQVATGRTIAGNGTSRPLTLSVLDKDSTDADRPDPEEASTEQRLLIKGMAVLPDNNYRMRLSVKDKAGNEVDDVEFIMITVDTRSPGLHDVTSFTSPFRIFDGADEDCQLAWQGTEATDQTLMRSRWSQPIGTGRSLGGWRLNQPIPTAAPSLFKVGYPYAWASATGNFIIADVAGNRTSGQVTFNAMTSGANFASYVTPMPSGSFDRARAQGDTFVDYRPEQEDPIDQQAFPWSDDDDDGPRAYTFPTQSGIWALLGRIEDTGPIEEGEERTYSWDWSFRRFASAKAFREEILEVTDPDSDDYPNPLDRLGATSVTPLDPQVSPGNADDLYMRPAIITIAPSWKPKASLGDSDRVRIAVTEKPDGYPFSTGLITVGATNDPADAPAAESYSNGLSRMFLPARENVTSGFSNVGYAYLASGEGSGSSGGAAPAPLFYDQEPVTISPYSLLGGALHGDVDYGNLTAYWLNAIRLSPDVVATGGVRTIRISAGFFTDQLRADLFSKTGDYVHFRTQDDQDLTIPVSEYAGKTADELKDKIAIVSQRMVYPDGNVWQRQQLELQVALGPEVPAALYHVDVKLGAVKAYSDTLSQTHAGANGSHRMKEALAVVGLDLMYGKVDAETGRGMVGGADDVLINSREDEQPLPKSNPRPMVKITSVAVSGITATTASAISGDVRIEGEVSFALADIIADGSADPTSVVIEIPGCDPRSISLQKHVETASLLRPYAKTFSFSTDIPYVGLMPFGFNGIRVSCKDPVLGNRTYATANIQITSSHGETSLSGQGAILSMPMLVLATFPPGKDIDQIIVGGEHITVMIKDPFATSETPRSYMCRVDRLTDGRIAIYDPLYECNLFAPVEFNPTQQGSAVMQGFFPKSRPYSIPLTVARDGGTSSWMNELIWSDIALAEGYQHGQASGLQAKISRETMAGITVICQGDVTSAASDPDRFAYPGIGAILIESIRPPTASVRGSMTVKLELSSVLEGDRTQGLVLVSASRFSNQLSDMAASTVKVPLGSVSGPWNASVIIHPVGDPGPYTPIMMRVRPPSPEFMHEWISTQGLRCEIMGYEHDIIERDGVFWCAGSPDPGVYTFAVPEDGDEFGAGHVTNGKFVFGRLKSTNGNDHALADLKTNRKDTVETSEKLRDLLIKLGRKLRDKRLSAGDPSGTYFAADFGNSMYATRYQNDALFTAGRPADPALRMANLISMFNQFVMRQEVAQRGPGFVSNDNDVRELAKRIRSWMNLATDANPIANGPDLLYRAAVQGRVVKSRDATGKVTYGPTGSGEVLFHPTSPETVPIFSTGSKFLLGAWRPAEVGNSETDFISNSQNETQILHFNTGLGWSMIQEKAIAAIIALDKYNKGEVGADEAVETIIDAYGENMDADTLARLRSYPASLAISAITSGLAGEVVRHRFEEMLMIGKLAMSYKQNAAATPSLMDLFIAYDIASGEGFHLFGIDAFNDIIATHAGALFGADANFLSPNFIFAGDQKLKQNIEGHFKAARSEYLAHQVMQNRASIMNAFFSLMMSTETTLSGLPKSRKRNWEFVPVKIELDVQKRDANGQRMFEMNSDGTPKKNDSGHLIPVIEKKAFKLWGETIGTIVQRQIDGQIITKSSNSREIDPGKEREFLAKVEALLTELNASSYVGSEANLDSDSVKALYEMMEMYALLTE
ncbi:MAG: hypothetical protein H0W78_02695 [Planctomycetes bacterium]|nr:hypothetical protein [Planctomycetota bacterium]